METRMPFNEKKENHWKDTAQTYQKKKTKERVSSGNKPEIKSKKQKNTSREARKNRTSSRGGDRNTKGTPAKAKKTF